MIIFLNVRTKPNPLTDANHAARHFLLEENSNNTFAKDMGSKCLQYINPIDSTTKNNLLYLLRQGIITSIIDRGSC